VPGSDVFAEKLLVLLDRDGVINEDLGTWVQSPEDFVLIPGVGMAIAALNKAGHSVAIVTNQSCVGRGLISMETLEVMHKKMIEVCGVYP
jgi:D-glycero-D-manno-heptose 1,7-bisphosphate phosphatase